MRSLFSIVGLVVVLAVVGFVIKAQMKPAGTHETPTQTTQQVKDQVNAAMQAAPKPDADK